MKTRLKVLTKLKAHKKISNNPHKKVQNHGGSFSLKN